MQHHLKPRLPGVFSRDISSCQVKHIRSSLRANTVHQHFLSNASWASDKNRLDQGWLFMHSLGSCKTNHRERSKRQNSTNQFIANNFCVQLRAGTQGKSMSRYDFLWGCTKTKTYSEFHLKSSHLKSSQGGQRNRQGLSAGTVATKKTPKEPNNRVLLEFNCLVVLFLLLYVICASVPAAGTERKEKRTFSSPVPHGFSRLIPPQWWSYFLLFPICLIDLFLKSYIAG